MSSLPPVVRAYRQQDLGRVLRLWQERGFVPEGPDGLTVDQALDLMASEDAVAYVAERDDEICGAAVGAVSGPLGWLFRIAASGPDEEDVAERLLDQLEATLAERGARRIAVGLAGDGGFERQLLDREYRRRDGMTLLLRDIPATVAGPKALEKLGGRIIDRDLWDQLKGMEEVKELIERRVILPLAEPERAARHGVSSPRAIVLFGPPGTGKTTFAKGIASRLEWPFVEIEPAELGGTGPEREAKLLAETFQLVEELAAAVVFVDEVEDIASVRHDQRRAGPSVINEFLRQMVRFRRSPHHLLVCATNRAGQLDPAFLRPGRFDYVLPVGPPDDEARAAMWKGYAEEIADEDVDIDALVRASELFTPADIEFAARKAAQLAFEREHFEGTERRASTEDFLAAIGETRPTLTDEAIAEFHEDRERFARF